ncbi:hypothetical protein NIES4074_36380 [Cylindrospermum sp. NIES-4074]|nr:hypothetical protein NIES4074_36380 [Cylindrospermum sp. NIES-4074]
MNSKIITTESSQGYTACVDKLAAKGVPVVTARRIAVAIANQEPFAAHEQALIDRVLDNFFSSCPPPSEVNIEGLSLFFAVASGLLLIRLEETTGQSVQYWREAIFSQAAVLIREFDPQQMQDWLERNVDITNQP